MDGLIRTAASRFAVLLFALTAWSGSSFAQQPTQAQVNAIRQACRADYQTYCASVPTGGSLPPEQFGEPFATLSASDGSASDQWRLSAGTLCIPTMLAGDFRAKSAARSD